VKTGVLLYCGRQDGLDLGGEHRIGQCSGRAAALPVGLRLATAVHTRPGHWLLRLSSWLCGNSLAYQYEAGVCPVLSTG
jgi:hypothetical protein